MTRLHKKIIFLLAAMLLFFIAVFILNKVLVMARVELPVKNTYFDVSTPSWINYVSLIIFTPIIEEFFYRYGLKFSVKKTSFLVLGIVYTIYLFFQPADVNFMDPKILTLFWVSLIISFFLIFAFVKKNKDWFKRLYDERFYLIFITSVVVFGYSHFTLYESSSGLNNILLSPFFLSTYFIAGIVYGLIRIRIGFVWGCLAHIFWNFFVTLNYQF